MERSRRTMVLGFVKEIWIQMRIFRLMLIIITPKTRGNRSEKYWMRIQGMSTERAPVVWMRLTCQKLGKIEN